MKVLQGKTMRKLKDKINNSSSSNKRKSKPMIRKIEDGEDLTPPQYTASAEDIVDDIKIFERVQSVSKPMGSPTSIMEHPMDEKDPEPLEEAKSLWRLQEPEIGQEIPDQHHLDFSSSSASSSSGEGSGSSDEDENDVSYTEFGGKPPVAVIGNIVLVTAEKETPRSPFSSAPTEPATPEEALKNSFLGEPLSDDDGSTNYVHKTTTYSVPEPEDEETMELWANVEKNVQLSQSLLGEDDETPDANGVEITVSEHLGDEQEPEDAPLDEQRVDLGETIEKKSYIDVTKFQIPSGSDHESVVESTFQVPISMDDMEESVMTVQMGNGVNASEEQMPFDQQQDSMKPPPMMYPNIYASSHIADEEEEFPEDEVDQETFDFLREIEDLSEDEKPPEMKEGSREPDSVFYGTTLSVAKTVAESVSTDSVVSVASKTAETVASAANTLDQASAPTLDTIFEKTSEMTPSMFDGFFENPKPRTSKRQLRNIVNLSFNSENSDSAGSEEAQMEPDEDSVDEQSRYGFDKAMDSIFASETFASVTKHVPDFVMQLVVDDADGEDDNNANVGLCQPMIAAI